MDLFLFLSFFFFFEHNFVLVLVYLEVEDLSLKSLMWGLRVFGFDQIH